MTRAAALCGGMVLAACEAAPPPSIPGAAAPVNAADTSVSALSQDELAALRSLIMGCWKVPAAARGTGPVVRVRFSLKRDGSLERGPEVVPDERTADPANGELIESTLQAVRQCLPIKNLPAEKYEFLREMNLAFSPQAAPVR